MPGCGLLPDLCAPQDDDSIDPVIEDLVRSFIDNVWNHPWTLQDLQAAQPTGSGGDPQTLPTVTEQALTTYLHQDYQRHRRDGSGARKKESGPGGLRRCIFLVKSAVTDLRITVLDIAVCDDCVAVMLLIEGQDLRPDRVTNLPGLFGAASPTGRRFRLHSSVLFCLDQNRIKGDHLLYGADLLFYGASQVGHAPTVAV
jgi:hypothetical protein